MTEKPERFDSRSHGRVPHHGHGLPPTAYTDPEIYALEEERLFRSGWICAARGDQLPEPGDYVTVDLLGEPLLVVRGRDDIVRVFSRVCRHRSADLLPGMPAMSRGHAAGFACPYHAWSYRLDGRLAGAPMMNDAPGVDRATCRLPEFRSEIWQGWVFVNLSGNADEFGRDLGGLDAFLAPYRLDEMVTVDTREFDSPWNWKVLVDNFMESYHHIATHRESLQAIFPAADSYVTESDGGYSLLVMPRTHEVFEDSPALPRRRLPSGLDGALLAGVVYPFHLFAVSADVLTWYQLIPAAHDRFSLRVSICIDAHAADREESRPARERQMDLTAQVHGEDIGACDAVWNGLQSRTAVVGPLCEQERALQQFASWWRSRMGRDSR